MYSSPIRTVVRDRSETVDSGFALRCSSLVLNRCRNFAAMFSQILRFLHVADYCCFNSSSSRVSTKHFSQHAQVWILWPLAFPS